MAEILKTTPGQDAIKGGIFYGSNLTPQGSFSNVPQKVEVKTDLSSPQSSIKLTLEKLKESFNKAAKNVTKTDNVLSDNTISLYLNNFTQLLIDYEDVRNLIYFGSSYNELVYNIDFLKANFPFRAYVARTTEDLSFKLETLYEDKTKITIRNEDIVFEGNLNFDNSGKTIWVGEETSGIGYDFVDNNSTRFPILSFNNVILRNVLTYETFPVNFYKITLENLIELKSNDILQFYDQNNDNIGFGKIQEYIPYTKTTSSFGFTTKTYKNYNFETPDFNNLSIVHNLNCQNLNIKGFNKTTPNVFFEFDESEVIINSNNEITINSTLNDLNGFVVIITAQIEQEGNVICDLNQNWTNNSLRNLFVEIENVQYKIIGNTNNLIFLETKVKTKKDDFYIIEEYSPIELNNLDQTSLFVRFTPVLFENSYATSGNLIDTTYVLNDEKKNWEIDRWVNKYVTIIEGKGAGKSFKILNNTSSQLIVDGDFGTPLDPSSRYLINNYPNNNCYFTCPISIMEFIVNGNLSLNGLLNYSVTDTIVEKGFIISPKLSKIINFTTQLTGIQKALINPLNPTPWPRERFTENIIISGSDFDNWIENPYNMTKVWSEDVDFYNDETVKYNLKGAITLDETQTNILIRKFIPNELINELNETDNRLFSRFVLLAGKMFDTIKVYIDFLKYTHSLNYSKINQLSPQFYKQYAEHYGFSLFDEDEIEVAKTIIYGDQLATSSLTPTFSDSQNVTTVKDIINEKQKLLLINLFHIYQTKGTVDCLKYLTSLLGAPEGLVMIEEFAYNQTLGEKIINNNKVSVPKIKMIIDESYLINKTNINAPENYPYVYKYELDNDNIANLREMSIGMSPLQAIINDIIKYGAIKHAQGIFKTRSFGSLQDNQDYYALPLTFPDKYCGMTIDYNLPKDGFKKGVVGENNCSFNLCSLYKIKPIEYKTPIISINNIQSISGKTVSIDLTTSLLKDFVEKDFMISVCFPDINISSSFYVTGNISSDTETVLTIKTVQSVALQLLNSTNGYIICKAYNPIYSSVLPIPANYKYNYKIPPINLTVTDNVKDTKTVLQKDNLLGYQPISNFLSFMTLQTMLGFDEFGENSPNVGLETSVYINFTSQDSGKLKNSVIGRFIIKNTLEETISDLVENITNNYSSPNFSIVLEDTGIYFAADYLTPIGPNSYISFSNFNSLVLEFSNFYNDKLQESFLNGMKEEYIYVSVEDKDLVVRLKLRSENNKIIENSDSISRIAIYNNFFEDDGLNHKLKILLTPKGVEIFKDNVFVGIAFWKKVDIFSNYSSRTFPKSLINTLNFSPLPIDMFATPGLLVKGNDILNWWDLFVGYPVNMKISILKIAILENLYISQPDIINLDSKNYICEKWIFDFQNQAKDKTGAYMTDELKIKGEYILGNPILETSETNIVSAIDNFILSHIEKLTLTSKSLNNGKVVFEETNMDFFKNNNNQLINIEELFKHNAFSPTLHTDYEYYKLNNMIENYYTYAEVSLTYKNLLPFIETVEAKFKKIVEQFLPIVLNLSVFGRTMQNFFSKAYYSGAYINDLATRISDSQDPDLVPQIGSDKLVIAYSTPQKPAIKKEYIYFQKEQKENLYIYKQKEQKENLYIYKQKEN